MSTICPQCGLTAHYCAGCGLRRPWEDRIDRAATAAGVVLVLLALLLLTASAIAASCGSHPAPAPGSATPVTATAPAPTIPTGVIVIDLFVPGGAR